MLTPEIQLLFWAPVIVTAGYYLVFLNRARNQMRKKRPNYYPQDVPLLSSSRLVHWAIWRIHLFCLTAFLFILALTASIDFLKNAFDVPACPELAQFYAHRIYIAISCAVVLPLFIALQIHLQKAISTNHALSREKTWDLLTQCCIYLSTAIYTATICETIASILKAGINTIALYTLIEHSACAGIIPVLFFLVICLPSELDPALTKARS